MKIYYIRHGQTDWNLARKMQGGETEKELNSTGIEQAKQTKKQIDNYKIDLIICSPLKRARKTAEIVNEDKKCKIIYNKALEERGYGDFEGKTKDEIKEMIDETKESITKYSQLKFHEDISSSINTLSKYQIFDLLDHLYDFKEFEECGIF